MHARRNCAHKRRTRGVCAAALHGLLVHHVLEIHGPLPLATLAGAVCRRWGQGVGGSADGWHAPATAAGEACSRAPSACCSPLAGSGPRREAHPPRPPPPPPRSRWSKTWCLAGTQTGRAPGSSAASPGSAWSVGALRQGHGGRACHSAGACAVRHAWERAQYSTHPCPTHLRLRLLADQLLGVQLLVLAGRLVLLVLARGRGRSPSRRLLGGHRLPRRELGRLLRVLLLQALQLLPLLVVLRQRWVARAGAALRPATGSSGGRRQAAAVVPPCAAAALH